jgi:hypothetical protein
VEEPIITKSQKGAAGPEFNKDHAHCVFDVKGIIHREFVPSKMTVNSEFYCDVLRRLRENMRRKRRELWRNHNWLLHHDNTPTRTHVPENNRVFD